MNKPTGLASQAPYAGAVGIEEWIQLYWGEKVHVFSRLDKGTSGVMVLALNARAAQRADDLQKSGDSTKEYVFLSHADSLKIRKEQSWTIASNVDGKSAKTDFTREGPAGKYFLYRAKISRGRLHQIRRHAKESKISILGDTEYQGQAFPRLCLHCKSTSWPEIPQTLVAPIPASMGSLGDFQNDAGFLASFDRRLKFFTGVTDAFRCVHRGEMKALDCAIDFYAGYFCVWIYDENKATVEVCATLKPYLKKLTAVYGAIGTVIKRSLKNPHSKGLVQEQTILGETPPPFFDVTEHGLKYQVTLTEGQHVGLFLDQRDNRKRVLQMAAGQRVANLFAYTSSFSVAAAAACCDVVFSVDVAQPCLDIGKINFEKNALFASNRGKFIKDDVRTWLKRQERKIKEQGDVAKFGVIICDPPTFSSTRDKGLFAVEKEWQALAQSCKNLLLPNGSAFFSTNHHEKSRDYYKKILQDTFKHVVDLPAPLDFPVINERENVKLFYCSL